METVQKPLKYQAWVTSGKTVGLVFNEHFEVVIIDNRNEHGKRIEHKIPGGKRKRNNDLDIVTESSEACINRELIEEIFVRVLDKKFAGTLIIEDERRAGFLHTKDVYIIEDGQYKEVGKVHDDQVYQRKFYPIYKAWDIIHKTHRPLLAIGLVSFFATHPELKERYELTAMFAEDEAKKVERKNKEWIEKIVKK